MILFFLSEKLFERLQSSKHVYLLLISYLAYTLNCNIVHRSALVNESIHKTACSHPAQENCPTVLSDMIHGLAIYYKNRPKIAFVYLFRVKKML